MVVLHCSELRDASKVVQNTSKLPAYRRELAAVCHARSGGAIGREVSGHGYPGQPAFVVDLVDPRDWDLGVSVDEGVDATWGACAARDFVVGFMMSQRGGWEKIEVRSEKYRAAGWAGDLEVGRGLGPEWRTDGEDRR